MTKTCALCNKWRGGGLLKAGGSSGFHKRDRICLALPAWVEGTVARPVFTIGGAHIITTNAVVVVLLLPAPPLVITIIQKIILTLTPCKCATTQACAATFSKRNESYIQGIGDNLVVGRLRDGIPF